jgi:hypothetical protein
MLLESIHKEFKQEKNKVFSTISSCKNENTNYQKNNSNVNDST